MNEIKSVTCELLKNTNINGEHFILEISWSGNAPLSGQFFMLRPLRFGFFLGRPVSVFEWQEENKIARFLIAKCGRGTDELSQSKPGDKIELTGPIGNTWANFIPASDKKVALVGGGAGIAPLAALLAERPDGEFHVFAGFKNSFSDKAEENAMLGTALYAKRVLVSAEYGNSEHKGRIVDFFDCDPNVYSAAFACGPQPMLITLKKKCERAGLPCFISMESRMACGVGACLGCTVKTTKGNRRCCADGPIFPAEEIIFNE